MAYIGKEPIVGNFQKCDALTASATADYTLQVGSSNVSPESVNHMIVSLNGVIQQPTTSYTVSGSTLSFASALTSNDTIDFVMLLGNVLDIGTPSDDTVATAKIQDDAVTTAKINNDAVTLAKMASGTDGNLITYDASGNPVAVATGDDGQVLTSAGAGQPCAFEDASGGGITAASQWRLTTSFAGDADPIASNWEEIDTPTSFGVLGSSMTESSGIFTFPSTGYWYILGQIRYYMSAADGWAYGGINTTHDDSTWAGATQNASYAKSGNYATCFFTYIFDVTSTSTHKCQMYSYQYTNNSNQTYAHSDVLRTGLTFIRLADT